MLLKGPNPKLTDEAKLNLQVARLLPEIVVLRT